MKPLHFKTFNHFTSNGALYVLAFIQIHEEKNNFFPDQYKHHEENVPLDGRFCFLVKGHGERCRQRPLCITSIAMEPVAKENETFTTITYTLPDRLQTGLPLPSRLKVTSLKLCTPSRHCSRWLMLSKQLLSRLSCFSL